MINKTMLSHPTMACKLHAAMMRAIKDYKMSLKILTGQIAPTIDTQVSEWGMSQVRNKKGQPILTCIYGTGIFAPHAQVSGFTWIDSDDNIVSGVVAEAMLA